ncbi:MAG: hypothetical protein QNK23_18585 [Crocinitomicaceae bacterium]|nr:hypothetical protein [Crocinitomicaceae bacterium]
MLKLRTWIGLPLIIVFNTCYGQLPVIVDSILIDLIPSCQSIMLESDLGTRSEYKFDINGNCFETIHVGLQNRMLSAGEFIVSHDVYKYKNDSLFIESTDYELIVQGKKILLDSSRTYHYNYPHKASTIVQYGDSTCWRNLRDSYIWNYCMVKKNNRITEFGYAVFIDNRERNSYKWKISHTDERIVIVHVRTYEIYEIQLKNGKPTRINHYEGFNPITRDYDLSDAEVVIQQMEQIAVETFKIKYDKEKPIKLNKRFTMEMVNRYNDLSRYLNTHQ